MKKTILSPGCSDVEDSQDSPLPAGSRGLEPISCSASVSALKKGGYKYLAYISLGGIVEEKWDDRHANTFNCKALWWIRHYYFILKYFGGLIIYVAH